jgi:hypothetical protein
MRYGIFGVAARRWAVAALLAVTGIGATACGDDDDDGTGPGQEREFNQVQRLGNPLLSEVTLAKRSHPTHGTTDPTDDPALIAGEVAAFIRSFGRSEFVVNTLAGVLIPDLLVVRTDRDPGTSGWLSWALAGGWGGRNLEDDVTDAALDAIFGDLIESAGAIAGLETDNVGFDSPALPTFPYLGAPN